MLEVFDLVMGLAQLVDAVGLVARWIVRGTRALGRTLAGG